MYLDWKLSVPKPFRFQPVLDALRNLAQAHPGMLLTQPAVPDGPPLPVEVHLAAVEEDLEAGRLPEEVDRLLRDPNFFFAYDDLGFVVVMLVDRKKEWMGPVYRELEEGLPVGRPQAFSEKSEPDL